MPGEADHLGSAASRTGRSGLVGIGGGERRRPLTSIAALGFLATALIVIGGALAGGAEPGGAGRLWAVPAVPVRPSVSLLPALTAYFGGMILFVRSWLLLRRHHIASARSGGLSVRSLAIVVLIWSAPLLIGPPLGSRDVYAYAAQGRLADQGYDVYSEGPAELGADDPVLAPVDPLYHETPVVYGPVFVSLSSWVAATVGARVVAAVLAFRALAVLGLVVAALAVHDLARGLKRDPVDALILAIANPLVLFHLVSGAHNEAIMLAFLLSGVAIGRRRPLLPLGIALCAFAAAIKLPAILAVAFLGWPWAVEAWTAGRRVAENLAQVGARVALVAGEALLVIAAAGRLTGWGWGWVDAIGNSRPVNAYLSITRLIGGGFSLLTGLDVDRALVAARLSGLLLAAGVTCLLLLRNHRSWPTALAWSLLLWAVLHPTTQPWYLTWGVMLLAATSAGERNRGLIAACVFGSFVVLPIGPQLGLVALDDIGPLRLLAATVVLALLTFSPARERASRRRADTDPGTVSVIVPTRHEAENVSSLVAELRDVAGAPPLSGRRVEVLFVDDSDDDTPAVIEALVEATGPDVAVDGRPAVAVELFHRSGEDRWGGLGGAVVDGLTLASGSVVVVMDGDLQHPVATIPQLVAEIDRGADVAPASRRVEGGSDHLGLSVLRRWFSHGGASLARWLFPIRLGPVRDPLTGFFALRLGRVDLQRLQPDGFKILVEILATHPGLRVGEVPFRFVERRRGLSKASPSEGMRFLGHLADLRIRTTRVWAGAPVPQRMFRSVFGRA